MTGQARETATVGQASQTPSIHRTAPADAREPVILLVHRIPYPPNKGDKIRSYHLLRFLRQRYAVHLGAFVDDPADWAHVDTLQALCASVHLAPLRRWQSGLRALPGLVTGSSITVPWYRSPAMAEWVARTFAATGARRAVAFSAAMAQYLDGAPRGTRRILDMVDVDSEKWRQYGARRSGPSAWIYRREGRRLLQWERDAAAECDATVLVTQAEADLLRSVAPETAEAVHAVENGVDTAYFDPTSEYPDPYPAACVPLVFTGAMDYWANVDAVTWFARSVLPRVRAACPEARFFVVGARPTEAVRALAGKPGVEVTGGVPDMRPWLAHAALAVAPLRVARGVQNKVLEAFAMGRPVLATSMALQGLDLGGDYPLSADAPDDLAALALGALNGEIGDGLGSRMREWVRTRYDWSARLAPFGELLEAEPRERKQTSPELAAAPASER